MRGELRKVNDKETEALTKVNEALKDFHPAVQRGTVKRILFSAAAFHGIYIKEYEEIPVGIGY